MKLKNLISETFILGDNLTKNSPSHAFAPQQKVSEMKYQAGDVTVWEFQTYPAWKRAVMKIKPDAEFYGDKDIGGAKLDKPYYAEWHGETARIELDKSQSQQLSEKTSTNGDEEIIVGGVPFTVEFDYATDTGPTWVAYNVKQGLKFSGKGSHDLEHISFDIEEQMAEDPSDHADGYNPSRDITGQDDPRDLYENEVQSFDDIELRKGRVSKPYYPNKGTYVWQDPKTKKKFEITFDKSGIADIAPTYEGPNHQAFNANKTKELFNNRNYTLISSILAGVNNSPVRVIRKDDPQYPQIGNEDDQMLGNYETGMSANDYIDMVRESNLPDPSKWGQPKLKENKNMKKDKNLLNERILGLAGIVPLQSIGFTTNSPAQSVNEWDGDKGTIILDKSTGMSSYDYNDMVREINLPDSFKQGTPNINDKQIMVKRYIDYKIIDEVPVNVNVLNSLANFQYTNATTDAHVFTVLCPDKGFAFSQKYQKLGNGKASHSAMWQHESGRKNPGNIPSYDELESQQLNENNLPDPAKWGQQKLNEKKKSDDTKAKRLGTPKISGVNTYKLPVFSKVNGRKTQHSIYVDGGDGKVWVVLVFFGHDLENDNLSTQSLIHQLKSAGININTIRKMLQNIVVEIAEFIWENIPEYEDERTPEVVFVFRNVKEAKMLFPNGKFSVNRDYGKPLPELSTEPINLELCSHCNGEGGYEDQRTRDPLARGIDPQAWVDCYSCDNSGIENLSVDNLFGKGTIKLNENKNMKKDKNLLNERILGLAGIVPLQSIGFTSNSPAQSVNEWEEEDLSRYDAELATLEDPRANKTSRAGKFGKDSWDDERYEKEEIPDEWTGGPPDELSEREAHTEVDPNKRKLAQQQNKIKNPIDYSKHGGKAPWQRDQERGLAEDDFTPQNFPKEEANKNADMTERYLRDLNGPVPVAKQGVDGYEFEVYFQNGQIDDIEVVSGDFIPNVAMTRQLLDQGLSLGDAILSSKGRMPINESRIGKLHDKHVISERAMGMLGLVPLQSIGLASNAPVSNLKKNLREVTSDLSRAELYRYLPMVHSSILMKLSEDFTDSRSVKTWDVIVKELTEEYLCNAMAKQQINKILKSNGVI